MGSIDVAIRKERLAGSLKDEERPSDSEGEAPVEIRSPPTYPLLVDPEQRAAAEHFGILRARLLNARAKSDIRSVVIASPQKQDGKSLTSANLAISLAQLQ